MSHSEIVQLTYKKVKKENYIHDYDYYESDLMNYIAEYIDDEVPEKNYIIKMLKEKLKGAAEFENDSFVITDKEAYFRPKFQYFKELYKNANAITFEQFCRDTEVSNGFYRLKQAYDERYDVYVENDEFGLITFDQFMREAKNGDKLYIGGAVGYKY